CWYYMKYRGKNSFKRRDHRLQHLRNYHHMGEVDGRFKKSCFCVDCPAHRDGHNYTEFQCDQIGCERASTKGHFRKTDHRKRQRKVHGL
ncbi:hypothetical protein BDY21DRAFT_277970, partial [Lineolata rhizophorae]